MFCTKCGAGLTDQNATVCCYCNEPLNPANNPVPVQPVPQPPNMPLYPPPVKGDIKPLLSMIFGITAIVMACCCYVLGAGFGIAAIILALLSKTDHNKGFKIAGLVTGIIGLVFDVFQMLFVFAFGFAEMFSYEYFMHML